MRNGQISLFPPGQVAKDGPFTLKMGPQDGAKPSALTYRCTEVNSVKRFARRGDILAAAVEARADARSIRKEDRSRLQGGPHNRGISARRSNLVVRSRWLIITKNAPDRPSAWDWRLPQLRASRSRAIDMTWDEFPGLSVSHAPRERRNGSFACRLSRTAAPGVDRRQHRPCERRRVRSGLQGAQGDASSICPGAVE